MKLPIILYAYYTVHTYYTAMKKQKTNTFYGIN